MLTLTYAVIANLFFGSVTQFGGFSPIAGVNEYTPAFVGDIATDRDRLYYIALVVSVVVYLLIKYITRTPFGIAFAGIRDEPVRMASLGYTVPLHRMLAFGFAAFIASLAGILYVWWNGQIAPQDLGLGPTIDLLIIAVIGGLGRIEGAWIGAFAFIVINNYVVEWVPTGGLPVVGGRVRHDHRARLPRHRARLARRADWAMGPNLGHGTPSRWAATGRSGDSRRGDRDELVVKGWKSRRRLVVGSPR